MTRGGKRAGAGRPAGSGRFGEKTRAVRLPESMIESVQAFVAHQGYKLPLYSSKVRAGFPSPADEFIEAKLDLNELLVKHPAATFFVRVAGDSMINAGINDGDILVVDRGLEPTVGKIVIAAVNGELTVKRLQKDKHGKFLLMPENPDYPPIIVNPESGAHIWGVVTNVIHSF